MESCERVQMRCRNPTVREGALISTITTVASDRQGGSSYINDHDRCIRRSGRVQSSTRTSVPSAIADGSRRKKGRSVPPASAGSSRVKIIKKPRDPEIIEAEITEAEKRLRELSEEMAKPEVARDITKLVAVNDEYERVESRLAELIGRQHAGTERLHDD